MIGFVSKVSIDRGVRSRVRRLQKRLAGRPDEDPNSDEGLLSDNAPDPAEILCEDVMPYTSGKRTLFISNREDPHLRAMLEDKLGLDLQWSQIDGSPRRVESSCASIRGKTYDLVLMATGFAAHKTEIKIKRTCRTVGVPYVSVNKGRPISCARALARAYGVRQ